MAARRVRRYSVPAAASEPALSGVGIEGPDALIDRIWALVNEQADASYRDAGGRQKPASEHSSLAHRRFDASMRFFTADGDHAAGGGAGRPSVVVTIGIDDLVSGRDGAGRAAACQVGTGPISDELVAEYAAKGDLSVLLQGAAGRPLWLGRLRRHASAAQFLALVVRDRGCVLCGAVFNRCEAHHVIPWNAPGKGRTDLHNLVLLCGACHRRVHDERHTLHRHRSEFGGRCDVWATRPATESELPPPTPIQRE